MIQDQPTMADICLARTKAGIQFDKMKEQGFRLLSTREEFVESAVRTQMFGGDMTVKIPGFVDEDD